MNNCEAGCRYFSGMEVRHIHDCVHYPKSFSEMYDMAQAKLAEASLVMRPLSTPPDTGRKVILWFKQKVLKGGGKVVFEEKICQTYARFIKAFTEECNCEYSGDCDCQYGEDQDQYFYPEGWYESTAFNDEYNCWPIVENQYQELIGWTETQPEPRMT